MSVKDIDNTKEFIKRFEEIENKELRIGIQGKEASAYHVDSRTGKRTARMVVIAGANEFGAHTGTTVIPERSFIRGTFDTHKESIAKTSEQQLSKVVTGELSGSAAFRSLGEEFERMTKEFLTNLTEPPNAPVTIALKGSSNPLIDTGRLRNSITHKVGEKGG